ARSTTDNRESTSPGNRPDPRPPAPPPRSARHPSRPSPHDRETPAPPAQRPDETGPSKLLSSARSGRLGAADVTGYPLRMADPVSWLMIEPGWKVLDADGEEVGAVDE